ncbi:uncharacterized protein MONOS_2003 [Monocercomonoides exilis]|uniref:uncharacterized protein n=1 Tax=Monocercomonoides exilis TaxID=2049356 RepID=UPI00355988F2|nr:hypothetical protein MONOS_2003 [Monocercomonoides exilis]|eukprot:MONOS_2003.1-p1 / transcript=MONOS_2003.1 / gene=MONOS_2003 / organism=Monocercomonoides_exilis_PA203 / gene_product=unspecified product / transcript_product=unspecified product / location=Mono_scaffold00038:159376-167135(+) / protein_length=2362 / sequence_SO=supercontig / SO=protein_coding / is_pseudo=false
MISSDNDSLLGSKPFYGVVVEGSTANELFAFNSSFERSSGIIKNTDFLTTRGSFTEGETIFEECSFTGCSSLHGGAITVSGNGVLTIKTCLFSKCNCTYTGKYAYGGAVLCYGTNCEILNTTFFYCVGVENYSIGGAFIHTHNGLSLIKGCSFIGCEAAFGGAIAWDEGGSGCAYDSTFDNNKARTGYAGTVFLQDQKVMCNFSNCSVLRGYSPLGAAGIDTAVSYNEYRFSINFCFFAENKMELEMYAADIFIETSFEPDYGKNLITNCYSLSTAKRRVVVCSNYNGQCEDNDNEKNSWLPIQPIEICIKGSGTNICTCGREGSECKTVAYGITLWRSDMKQNIILAGEEFIEDEILLNGKSFIFVGCSDKKTKLKCLKSSLNECLLVISNGSLTVNTISFVSAFNRTVIRIGSNGITSFNDCSFENETSLMDCSCKTLICIDSGSLKMVNSRICDFNFEAASCISMINAQNIEISLCTFENIMNDGNGGCIYADYPDVGNERSIDINGSKFINCNITGTENEGGGMFISISNGCSFNLANTEFEKCVAPFEIEEKGKGGGLMIILKDLSFEFNLSGGIFGENNNAKYGKDVFIRSINLLSAININRFLFWKEDDASDKLMGMENSIPDVVIPLEIYFLQLKSAVKVAENGVDYAKCGFESFPCQTLGYSFFRKKGFIKNVEIFEGVQVNEKIIMNDVEYNINGGESMSTMRINRNENNDESNGMIEISESCTFKSIKMMLCNSIRPYSSLLKVNADCLNIDNIIIEGNSEECNGLEVEYNIISILNGHAIANQLFIDGITICDHSIIELIGGDSTATIIACEWRNIHSSGQIGLIHVTEYGFIDANDSKICGCIFEEGCGIKLNCPGIATIGNISFLNNTISKGNGTCINCQDLDDKIDKITIYDCNFEECKVMSDEDGGGGLFCSLSNSSEIIISSCHFNRCEAPTDQMISFGGGILLDSNEADCFILRDLDFSYCSAKFGKNMFIQCADLFNSVTTATFCFDVSKGWEDDNLFVGNDKIYKSFDITRLLLEYTSEQIFVSETKGLDTLRCGRENEPCLTVPKCIEHFRHSVDPNPLTNFSFSQAELIDPSLLKLFVIEDVLVDSKLDLSGICITSAMPLERSFLRFNPIFNCKAKGVVDCESIFENSRDMTIKLSVKNISIKGVTLNGMSFFKHCCSYSDETECIENDKMIVFELCENLGYCGRDVYVKCQSIEKQLSDVQFQINFNLPFDRELAIWGCTMDAFEDEEDLLPYLIVFKDEMIFVSNVMENNADNRQCGKQISPCTSVDIGMSHVIPSVYSHLLIYRSSSVNGEGYVSDVTIKMLDSDQHDGIIVLNNTIYNRRDALFLLNSTVNIYNVSFVFSNKFSSEHVGLLWMDRGNLNIDGVCFRQDNDEHMKNERSLNCSFVVVIQGSMSIRDCSVSNIRTKECFIDVRNGTTVRIERVLSNAIHLYKSFIIIQKTLNLSLSNVETFNEYSEGNMIQLNNIENAIVQVLTIDKCSGNGLFFETKNIRNLEISKVKISYSTFQFGWHIIKTEEDFDSERRNLEIKTESKDKESIKESSNDIKEEQVEISQIEGNGVQIKKEPFVSAVNLRTFSTFSHISLMNISTESLESSVFCVKNNSKKVEFINCSIVNCKSLIETGTLVNVDESTNLFMNLCLFNGYESESKSVNKLTPKEHDCNICWWNGSSVEFSGTTAQMKDTEITNSSKGGITMNGGNVNIEKGEFLNNNPSIEGYPSMRRNIICSDSGVLNVMSLKGGDGLKDNISLWMLNEGCSFDGIASERVSSFFIPVLECVEAKEETDRIKLIFKGMLLVPCNLSFSVVKRKGEEKEIEHYDFDSNGFLSEKEAEGSVAKDLLSNCGDEIEVSVHILFGDTESPSSTNLFILKNASETKENGNERIVEGGREQKSFWPIIVIIMAIILVIVLIASVILAVRWIKQKRRTEELEIIVEDTVRKDPKAFEMVTMEMSPEEQWRRAEREAEKKNEERIKKRVYEKSLGHSESSEHLLSESGSTEYILGKDSDKIPEWVLEKVDDEEETRKRSPSPSISSTSTTSTTDSDSTFVRGENLCPTTSSMSNLVDAMACSSPHEKLIVDLRDSLFMLLHGKNKTKEMPIGSLKEREQTAAQILFWVANLALHSFDEMENKLQSLANLSPHIVLFSEHMVICIVMHSDLSSDDSSDSSSISSSTVVTSASEDDDEYSLPSSAFEDDANNKKECLRWKAPELMVNRKMETTRKSVVFSIGMMAWECLTLQIPFGEYEAEVAGNKIANGERPQPEEINGCELSRGVKACVSQNSEERPGLLEVKRELFGYFPAGVMMVTVSDAIGLEALESKHENSCNTHKIAGKDVSILTDG